MQTLLGLVVFQRLMEGSSTKKGRVRMTPQGLEKMLVCLSCNQVMGDGRSNMKYQQAEPLGLKEEGGELPQH